MPQQNQLITKKKLKSTKSLVFALFPHSKTIVAVSKIDTLKIIIDVIDMIIAINPTKRITHKTELNLIIISIDDILSLHISRINIEHWKICGRRPWGKPISIASNVYDCAKKLVHCIHNQDLNVENIIEYIDQLIDNELNQFKEQSNNIGLLCQVYRINDDIYYCPHPSMVAKYMTEQTFRLRIKSSQFDLMTCTQISYLPRPLNLFEKRANSLLIAVTNRVLNIFTKNLLLNVFKILMVELVPDIATLTFLLK